MEIHMWKLDAVILPIIRPIFLLVAIATVWIVPVGTIIGIFSFLLWVGCGQATKEAKEHIKREDLEKSDFGKKLINQKAADNLKISADLQKKQQEYDDIGERFLHAHSEQIGFLNLKAKEINDGVGYVDCQNSVSNFAGRNNGLTYDMDIHERDTGKHILSIKLDENGQFFQPVWSASTSSYIKNYFDNTAEVDNFLIKELSRFI